MKVKDITFLMAVLFMAAVCFSGCAAAVKETGGPFFTKASKLQTGMTQKQVVEIIGRPSKTFRQYTVNGLIETWTYTTEQPYWIITFQNGLLSSTSH